ncbi:MAG: S-adenosyl-L-homocysteine hydrolase [Erythrobacter sp.]|uniref:S-adenosyl-L-homocysteine hydrolase n=1 Tax=Erythrobacter sp. TaxID=1042 RepID=UPI0032651874
MKNGTVIGGETDRSTGLDTQDKGFWRGARSTGTIMAFALGAFLTSTPAKADSRFEDAHTLRSLDIMLMVTALRCRSGPHDFQSDYRHFSAAHSHDLGAVGRTLRHSFTASYGEEKPERALDRMGVRIANSYGDGHPWLNCAELQQATRELTQSANAENLIVKARYLLSASRPAEQQSMAPQITYNMTADWEKRP